MNHFDLSFLKYLQDNSPLSIDEAVQRFGKTLSTLKRTMKELMNSCRKTSSSIRIISLLRPGLAIANTGNFSAYTF